MKRRTALKSVLAALASVGFGLNGEASLENQCAHRAVLDTLKYQRYVSPKLVGWKGYWYRAPHEIVAFEALDGTIVFSPWATQVPWSDDLKARKIRV